MIDEPAVRESARLIYMPNELPRLGINISNTTRIRWEAAGRFPKRLRLSTHMIGYLAADIEAYVAMLAQSRVEQGK